MQENKLIITHQDGSQNVVENPFLPMQATYAALAADPNAMPELPDESRAKILAEIADEKNRESETRHKQAFTGMNRHERRKAAAIARKK
jgi:hypothetical protein